MLVNLLSIDHSEEIKPFVVTIIPQKSWNLKIYYKIIGPGQSFLVTRAVISVKHCNRRL